MARRRRIAHGAGQCQGAGPIGLLRSACSGRPAPIGLLRCQGFDRPAAAALYRRALHTEEKRAHPNVNVLGDLRMLLAATIMEHGCSSDAIGEFELAVGS